MKEEFFHHLWKYKLFEIQELKTVCGQNLQIDKVGEHNTDSGPDFFNAKLQIGDVYWAGNVEIHIHSSDWYLHKHQYDKAYDNVVLHVVYNYDKPVIRSSGEIIPTLELKGKFDQKLFLKYDSMMSNLLWIPCQEHFLKIEDFIKQAWLERLLFERLERKTNQIRNELLKNNNNWEETLYFFLARSFGFNINAEPFELLAKSIPYACLLKHKNSLFQIQAILFGQAGFLEADFIDDYPKKLQAEYSFLKSKFNLTPINVHLWKFLRLRPSNFPTIRIAQFACFIYSNQNVFSKILDINSIDQAYSMFDLSAEGYWKTHYSFDLVSKEMDKKMGKKSTDIILINAVIPFLFLYGKVNDEAKFQQLAIDFFEQIDSERNNIVLKWQEMGLLSRSAFQSQSLLELKTQYCNAKKCLTCSIGINILKKDSL